MPSIVASCSDESCGQLHPDRRLRFQLRQLNGIAVNQFRGLYTR
jgi:hypothetical protein